MPWNPLRTTKGGDPGGLRRYSTIDPTQPTEPAVEHASNDINHLGHDNLDFVSSPSPLRNSFEPPAAEDATGRLQAPFYEELQPPKRNRFSMLSYRHRSDPQISKTAREHAAAATPPMPTGKTLSGRYLDQRPHLKLMIGLYSTIHHHNCTHGELRSSSKEEISPYVTTPS